MSKHSLKLSHDSVPSCCGARVYHDFMIDDESRFNNCDYKFEGETVQECCEKALEHAIKCNPGTTIQWWFAKSRTYNGKLNDEFEEQELMDVVLKHPKAKILAEYSNPNSGNYICGIIIDNETHPTNYINNQDYDDHDED